MNRRVAAAAALLAMAGCHPRPAPPPVSPPVEHPPLERTFGSATVLPDGGTLLDYKDLRVASDIVGRSLAETSSSIDFLLIGSATADLPGSARKDLKVVAPAAGAARIRAAGFANTRPLAGGQRLMLSKSGAFAFVTAVDLGGSSNGYLLEYDNGRNVFIGRRAAPSPSLREFVYGLRDDGKALHLAILESGRGGEDAAAEVAALLQPQLAVVVDRGGLDRDRFSDALAAQLFSGSWRLARPSETLPF